MSTNAPQQGRLQGRLQGRHQGRFHAVNEWFAELSPIMKFGVVAGALIVVFMLCASSVRPIAHEWAAEADAIEDRLREVRDASSLNREINSVGATIRSLGPVELPGEESVETEAMTAAVSTIQKAYDGQLEEYGYRQSSGNRLPSGTLESIYPGKRLKLIFGEMEFIAKKDIVTTYQG